ncbi:DnaT-like ssDNA-binding protein [Pelagibacterium sediminicola]|uniref:DnaT-like ssDNA-binding protein n=1 Tax=Pelagibacterium sediminicola TaxID=2248761 RepID=UPI000E30DC7D|nr:DnaT-like ssDNA-binding protein [Pelagibacterium sediminicola]
MLSFTEPAVTSGDADAYATARGWTDWTGDETVKAAAIMRGQTYLAGLYNDRWATEWENDQAPEPVKYAIIETARRELVSPGSLSPDFVASRVVSRERKKVGPLEKELEYAEATGSSSVRPQIAIIEQLLAGLLRQAFGGSVALTRV